MGGNFKIENFNKTEKKEILKFPNKLKKEVKFTLKTIKKQNLDQNLWKINRKLKKIVDNWKDVLIQESYINQEWKFNMIKANLCIINIKKIQNQMWERGKEIITLKTSLRMLEEEIKRLEGN